MTILSMLMVLLVYMVDQVSRIWRGTTVKASTFQEARIAFESMTRKVSQATLNTYWDYSPRISKRQTPREYVRQSELHYVQGPASGLLGGVTPAGSQLKTTGHAVFFQAPLGYTLSTASGEAQLGNLLNACGFFIQYAGDNDDRPKFLEELLPERKRYRLMELWQPTENLSVYKPTPGELDASAQAAHTWYRDALGQVGGALPLAENVIALVLWPKRSTSDPGAPLSTDYRYDTREYLDNTSQQAELTRNQLPPVVSMTMVALDEPSAARLEEKYQGNAPLLQPGALFKTVSGDGASEEQLREDLAELERFLREERYNYRVFSSNITIRQAKWSQK